MTQSSGEHVPQDRLPYERPPQEQAMPVIGADGVIVPAAEARSHGLVVDASAGARSVTSSVAVFGDVRRSGAWAVAEAGRTVSVFGDVMLDLRTAVLAARQVTINAVIAFGDLKVIVPPGVRVELDGFVLFGDRNVEPTVADDPDGPVVRLQVGGAFGDVKVLALAPGEPIPSWRDFFRRRN